MTPEELLARREAFFASERATRARGFGPLLSFALIVLLCWLAVHWVASSNAVAYLAIFTMLGSAAALAWHSHQVMGRRLRAVGLVCPGCGRTLHVDQSRTRRLLLAGKCPACSTAVVAPVRSVNDAE